LKLLINQSLILEELTFFGRYQLWLFAVRCAEMCDSVGQGLAPRALSLHDVWSTAGWWEWFPRTWWQTLLRVCIASSFSINQNDHSPGKLGKVQEFQVVWEKSQKTGESCMLFCISAIH